MKDELLKSAISDLPKNLQKELWAEYWDVVDGIINKALNYKNKEDE